MQDKTLSVKELFKDVPNMSKDYVSFYINLSELVDKFPKFRFCGKPMYDLKRMGKRFLLKMSANSNICM